MKKKALHTEEEAKKMSTAELCDDDLNIVTGGAMNGSSADDPSGYQISERMRVQTCAQVQTNYNAQSENSEDVDKFLPGTLDYAKNNT